MTGSIWRPLCLNFSALPAIHVLWSECTSRTKPVTRGLLSADWLMSVFVNELAPPNVLYTSKQGQCLWQRRKIMKDTLKYVMQSTRSMCGWWMESRMEYRSTIRQWRCYVIILRNQVYRITLYLSWTTIESITTQNQWSTGAYQQYTWSSYYYIPHRKIPVIWLVKRAGIVLTMPAKMTMPGA